MKNKGLFITFEGPEGSGKSTQVKLLSEYLTKQKIKNLTTREPGGTNISEQIREILLNPKNTEMHYITELLLYSASRSQHILEKIKPALERGITCISDRFSLASLAYQGYGRKIDLNLINTLTEIATQNLKPDLIFLLDIDIELGIERAKLKSNNLFNTDNGDRLENENIEFHKNIRNGYLELAKQFKNIHLIKYENSIQKIHKKITDIIDNYVFKN